VAAMHTIEVPDHDETGGRFAHVTLLLAQLDAHQRDA
jgi:hypothetical protein